MTNTPKIGAPELAVSQASKETTHNEALRYLEQGANHFAIKDQDLSTPPGSPADGDAYIVQGPGSGAWSAYQHGDIAFYMSSAWVRIVPKAGFTALVVDEDALHYYDTGTSPGTWELVSAVPAGSIDLDDLGDVIAPTPADEDFLQYESSSPAGWYNRTRAAADLGYLGAPQMSDQDDYTLTLADNGKHYYHTSGSTHTLTIPANASVAFPVGAVIAGVNENGAGNLSIAITSDTLRWGSSTGTRTVGPNGTFSLLKVTSTVWRLTGDEIT
jgi:hypothetical protein